jgi:hypothetical protein
MTEYGTPCEAPDLPILPGGRSGMIWHSCVGWIIADGTEWDDSISRLRAWLRPAPRPWVLAALHQRHLTALIRIAAREHLNAPTRTAAHRTMGAAYAMIWSHSKRIRR